MHNLTEVEKEKLLNKLMSAQLKLSLGLFSVFVVVLLGTPLLCYFYPDIVNYRVFGFPLNWLFLGLLFYPLTWAVAWIYVTKSIAMEEQLAREYREGGVAVDGGSMDSVGICNSTDGGYRYAGDVRSEKC
ncbi:DUF485 domain-containing protein [Desulfofalx alkaliphila]|uniref:DUF485 domain-containing protein n=1 Tax=Desulfofalx alkaliphila TaxID=105483 RepID=UPI00068C69DB|nr:DUF485 domain-containing protein [Desulfofalx alkaliphila]